MTPAKEKLRMEIAIRAMQSITTCFSYRSATFNEMLFYEKQIARNSFKIADEMIRVSDLKPEELNPTNDVDISESAFEKTMKAYKEKHGNQQTPPTHQILEILEQYLKNNKG